MYSKILNRRVTLLLGAVVVGAALMMATLLRRQQAGRSVVEAQWATKDASFVVVINEHLFRSDGKAYQYVLSPFQVHHESVGKWTIVRFVDGSLSTYDFVASAECNLAPDGTRVLLACAHLDEQKTVNRNLYLLSEQGGMRLSEPFPDRPFVETAAATGWQIGRVSLPPAARANTFSIAPNVRLQTKQRLNEVDIAIDANGRDIWQRSYEVWDSFVSEETYASWFK